jgi:hypothetical protein
MVDDIVKEVSINNITTTLYKEYTTSRHHQQYTLQIHRNIKHTYSFIIKKGSKAQFQFIYDPLQESYLGIRNINSESNVPALFLFIGCKVLFKLHGYCNVKSFKNLPSWYLKILFSKTFNGTMYKDIINGFVTL